MRDRTPTKALENGALRYGVYAEDGSLLRYEYLALEDEPADPGTELRKATLLQDSTEVSLFGSSADRTVDDAFAGIAGQLKLIKSDMAAITLTVQDTTGKPIPEVLVQGILSERGTAVYTNASGVATGYIGEGQQLIKVSGYADVADYSETLTVVKGTTITKTLTLTTQNFLGITSSKSIKFSGNVETIDYSVTSGGGGGGGGDGDSTSGSYGGAGGSGSGTIIKTGISVAANVAYPAVIGAGGKFGIGLRYNHPATDGADGGKSSFMGTSISGGIGGKCKSSANTAANNGGGIGSGGADKRNMPEPGGNATAEAFTSFTGTSNLGGGGAGGSSILNNFSAGGKVGGGAGGHALKSGTGGKANTGGGGGGGGNGGTTGQDDDPNGYPGGNGGSGFIGIRMHLKSAA